MTDRENLVENIIWLMIFVLCTSCTGLVTAQVYYDSKNCHTRDKVYRANKKDFLDECKKTHELHECILRWAALEEL